MSDYYCPRCHGFVKERHYVQVGTEWFCDKCVAEVRAAMRRAEEERIQAQEERVEAMATEMAKQQQQAGGVP